jgi:hypothetical protein
MAGGVPDGEKDGPVLRFCRLQGVRSPGVLVYWIVGMLQEIGTGFVGEAIRSCCVWLSVHGPR